MSNANFSNVNEYIAAQPKGAAIVLEQVRGVIRKALPGSEEVISYKMPGYKQDGEIVLYFAGWKEHYSLYPAGDAFVAALKGQLAPYKVNKGTIRFPLLEPVPVELIGRIAKLRAKEVAQRKKRRLVKAKPEINASRDCRSFLLPFVLLFVAYVGAGMAQTNPQAAKHGPETTATERDGSHDFDFIYGKFRMPNHRLVKRLAGSHEWTDFISCTEGVPLAGGIGDMDTLRTNYWKDFVGITVRTYDPETGLWRLYWFDNRFSHGVIDPPVVGKFNGNVGVFEGKDTFNGKPIIMRFTWTINPKGSEAVAKWEQAFSPDDGKTWETNWQNELIHDDHCNAN